MNFSNKFFVIIITLISTFQSNLIFSQISEGGTPPSFKLASARSLKKVPVKTTPILDLARLRKEDEETAQFGRPPRFGYAQDVNYNLDNSGSWERLPSGEMMWRLEIEVQGAQATSLMFSDFYIPIGGKLFIYNKEKSQVIGAFTERNNRPNRQFATQLVNGNTSILEYVLPANESKEKGGITISRVVNAYNKSAGRNSQLDFGDSGPCQVDVNCPEGDDWQDEKKGVALIQIQYNNSNSVGWCTGSLINNTANDCKPLFLTANHCLCIENDDNWNCIDSLDAITNNNAANWIFYFNYESPVCDTEVDEGSVNGLQNQTISGATILANGFFSDFALLELIQNPLDIGYDVYFNGWSRTNSPSSNAVGIHHPRGDVKKISIENGTIISGNYRIQGHISNWEEILQDGTHWSISDWDVGVTEGGSSGSPLFDVNSNIIGQLHGGAAACDTVNPTNDNNEPDYYGKIWYSWEGPNNQRRLKYWLDPSGGDDSSQNGFYNPCCNLSASLHVPNPNTNPSQLDDYVYFDFNQKKFKAGDDLIIKINDCNGEGPYHIWWLKDDIETPITTIPIQNNASDGQTYYQWTIPECLQSEAVITNDLKIKIVDNNDGDIFEIPYSIIVEPSIIETIKSVTPALGSGFLLGDDIDIKVEIPCSSESDRLLGNQRNSINYSIDLDLIIDNQTRMVIATNLPINSNILTYQWLIPEDPTLVSDNIEIRASLSNDPNVNTKSEIFSIIGYDHCEYGYEFLNLEETCTLKPLLSLRESTVEHSFPNNCPNTSIEGDIWCKVEVPPSGHVVVELTEGDGNVAMAAYDDCSLTNEIACDDMSDGSTKIELEGQIPNSILYFRIWYYTEDTYNLVDVCAYDGSAQLSQCTNGIQDGDELGVDCGGESCPPCPDNTTVNIPNGNENWTASNTYTIEWEANPAYASVRIGFSFDNGSTWIFPEDVGLPFLVDNTGSYDWKIPCVSNGHGFMNTTQASIGIFEPNGVYPNNLLDVSDSAFTITACQDSRVDLTAVSINIEPNSQFDPSQQLNALINLKNNGGRSADVDFSFGIYLSDNVHFNPATDIQLCQQTVSNEISAGQSFSDNCSITIPNDIAIRNYYLLYVVDDGSIGSYTEPNESDNILNVPITIGDLSALYTDLIISNHSISTPSGILSPSESYHFSVTVDNLGTTPNIENYLGLYLSTDNQVSSDDILLESIFVDDIAANNSYGINGLFTLPADIPAGNYKLLLFVDQYNYEPERNEDNNTVILPFLVEPLPDLSIQNLLVAERDAIIGAKVPFQVNLKNSGLLEANNIDLKIYLSHNNGLDSGDDLLGTFSIDRVNVNDFKLFEDSLFIPNSVLPTQTYYLIAKVDAAEQIIESEESNNILTTPVNFKSLGIEFMITPPSCGQSDGEVTANVIGGTAPFSYTWSNNATTETVANLPADFYNLTITDANNNQMTQQVALFDNFDPQYEWTDANLFFEGSAGLQDFYETPNGTKYLLYYLVHSSSSITIDGITYSDGSLLIIIDKDGNLKDSYHYSYTSQTTSEIIYHVSANDDGNFILAKTDSLISYSENGIRQNGIKINNSGNFFIRVSIDIATKR